jgi:dTDP-4-amino-4,6-dideoxygalactose transaminase
MIPLFKVHIPENIGQTIEEVFKSGLIGEGKQVRLFEKKLAKFIENDNISVVNSGTSALTLAYRMCDFKEGDEVITTPLTCTATNQPLLNFNAKIIFSDINPDTGNIDPVDVKKKITSKTKAIVGVHWGGQPFDLNAISEIANNYNLKVIEDAAHALGAKYDNKYIGNQSDFCCFSFQAIKHLTTGDGGAITSKNKVLKSQIDRLRWFGIDRNFKGNKWEQDIKQHGYKFQMNNINASIGILQFKHLDDILSKHKSNGKFYDQNILNSKVKLLFREPNTESSFWLYSLLIKDDPINFKKYMYKKGIEVDKVHVRNDNYSIFKPFVNGELKGVNEFSSKLINIPVGWWLSNADIEKIVNAINDY